MDRSYRSALHVLTASALLLAVTSAALAGSVSVEIAGRVVRVEDPFDLLEGSVVAGDPFTGSYAYESALEDADPSPVHGEYWNARFPSGIRLQIAGRGFESNPVDVGLVVEVTDAPDADRFRITSYNHTAPEPGIRIERIVWTLDDTSGEALRNDALPSRAPDLGRWDSKEGLVLTGCAVSEHGGCDWVRTFVVEVEVTRATDDTASVDCRAGTVNGALGTPWNVLFVNGDAGAGRERSILLRAGTPLEISVTPPPSRPDGPAPFCLYVWKGLPAATTVRPLPHGTGNLCMPSPITDPVPPALARIANNAGRELRLGRPDLPSSPAPCVVLSDPRGIGRSVDLFLQGIVLDDAAPNGMAAVTNGIVVEVR